MFYHDNIFGYVAQPYKELMWIITTVHTHVSLIKMPAQSVTACRWKQSSGTAATVQHVFQIQVITYRG